MKMLYHKMHLAFRKIYNYSPGIKSNDSFISHVLDYPEHVQTWYWPYHILLWKQTKKAGERVQRFQFTTRMFKHRHVTVFKTALTYLLLVLIALYMFEPIVDILALSLYYPCIMILYRRGADSI